MCKCLEDDARMVYKSIMMKLSGILLCALCYVHQLFADENSMSKIIRKIFQVNQKATKDIVWLM